MTTLARSNIVQQASIGLNFDIARGLDNVTYAVLKVLSFRVRPGWGGKYAAAAQRQRFSSIDLDAEDDTPDFAPDLPPKVGSAFQTLDHRKHASAQIEAFKGYPTHPAARSSRHASRNRQKAYGRAQRRCRSRS
ncbi:hypothetical protein [Sphingomonas paucimobilis]|uniref:hypothetical protein n=1 Tax=Sphingomonas paucimobilis TaxID=13689 RepID=UPI0028D8DD97|nr:hypothetical protein [Sphingomonas paucimobilis]